jgi:hypothetical protein
MPCMLLTPTRQRNQPISGRESVVIGCGRWEPQTFGYRPPDWSTRAHAPGRLPNCSRKDAAEIVKPIIPNPRPAKWATPPSSSVSVHRSCECDPPGIAAPLKSVVPNGPWMAKLRPVVKIELERIEALELLAMTLAHLNDAEARAEMSPRVPLLMTVRDKLARGLREEQ